MGLIDNTRLSVGPISFVKFGPLDTAYSDTNLPKDPGLIKGTGEINIEREVLELVAGEPEMSQDALTIAEKATVKLTFAEEDLALLQRYIGGGTLTTRTTNTANAARSISNEHITLDGTAYHKLNWQNVSSVVVTSEDATPVTYTVSDDYVVDATTGQIKRTSTGLIDDGETVHVSYSASTPAYDELSLGGSISRSYFSMRIWKKKRSTTPRYKVWTFYKVFTGKVTRKYQERNYNFVDVEFMAVCDSSQADGSQLYFERDEYCG